MLIHLNGEVKNDIIEFDLPQIYFKRGQSVAVAHVEMQSVPLVFFLVFQRQGEAKPPGVQFQTFFKVAVAQL